jgi:hypothetical protein
VLADKTQVGYTGINSVAWLVDFLVKLCLLSCCIGFCVFQGYERLCAVGIGLS